MLRTARLVLRPPRPGDLDALWRIMRDPEAMRYWDTPPHAGPEVTRAFLDRMLALPADQGAEFVIERDGAMIGRVALWRIAEIGYILDPAHWRQGVMREALTAALPWFFARFPQATEIVAEVDPRNAASLRLLAALGFVETGRASRTISVAGTWCDSVYLALPRPQPSPGVIR